MAFSLCLESRICYQNPMPHLILQLSIVTGLQRIIPKSRSEEIQLMRFTQQRQPIEPGVIFGGSEHVFLIQIAVFKNEIYVLT